MTSTNILDFPIAPNQEAVVPSEPLKTLLHVDDDADIRTIIKMALETVGSFDVHQFASGQEAVDAVDTVHPQLLLLDVMMPDMSGEDVWRKLTAKPETAGLPAVFLTAKAEDSFSQELLQKGALAVITKPVDPMRLSSQIEDIWQQAKATES